MRATIFLILILTVLISIAAVSPPSGALESDDDGDGLIDRWETINENGGLSIYMDTKGDGHADYLLEHDDEGYKSYEALDFNGDGELDDFYFYVREVLIRREIDSNYDGLVDVWVHLSEGVYVAGYERDTDFDGQIDLKKVFGEE